MGRNKWRVCRDGGLTYKRDTPVKAAPVRRQKLRTLLPSKTYQALPEEPEVEEMHEATVKTFNPTRTSIKPVYCKSVLHLSSPAFSENPRDAAVPANKTSGYQVSPAGHPTIHMVPDPEAFKSHSDAVAEEEKEQNCRLEEEQSVAVTPESIISSSMESDTIFNSDDHDDDEENCYSPASSSSSSLPSPEIFRRQYNAETETLTIRAEPLGPNIRNSTLLDVSHAQSIHMHQPPNLSAIINASTILAEKFEIRSADTSRFKDEQVYAQHTHLHDHNGGPVPESQIKTDAFISDKEIKCRTPAKLTKKRPILCKKRVSFKSPIITEILEPERTPAAKCTIHNTSEPGEEKSRAVKNSADDTLLLSVRLKRQIKSCPEKGKFFNFVSGNDQDVFFQMMRERSVKLRNAPLFPLTAAKRTVASVL